MKKEVKQPIMPYDILLSGIEAKGAESVRISRILKRSGVRVERSTAPGTICSVSSLMYVYRRYGEKVLKRTLKLCKRTWKSEVTHYSGNLLKTVAVLVATYGDRFKDRDFVKIFSESNAASSISIPVLRADILSKALGLHEQEIIAKMLLISERGQVL